MKKTLEILGHVALVWWFTYTVTNAKGDVVAAKIAGPFVGEQECASARSELVDALMIPGLSMNVTACQNLDRTPR